MGSVSDVAPGTEARGAVGATAMREWRTLGAGVRTT